MAADTEISFLTSGSTLSKATRKTWSSPPAEEEGEQPHVKFLPPESGILSPQLSCSEIKPPSIHEATSEDATQARLSLSFDTSQISVRSTDTTLEYYDATQSEEQDGEKGHTATEKQGEALNIRSLTEKEKPEEKLSPTTEQTPELTAENREEEEVKEDQTLEDVMQSGDEQAAKNDEEVQSENEEEQDVESSSKQDEAFSIEQEEILRHGQGKKWQQKEVCCAPKCIYVCFILF